MEIHPLATNLTADMKGFFAMLDYNCVFTAEISLYQAVT